MKKIIEFVRKERLYILLLIFIILINVLAAMPDGAKDKAAGHKVKANAEVKAKSAGEDLALKHEDMEKVLQEKGHLAILFSLVSLLILAILFLGIVIDAILFSLKFSKKAPDISTYRLERVKWNVWDVAKVVILFLFFGYMAIIIESVLARTFPVLKNENFRMVVNSSVLDVLTVVFILYFTVGQYKERAISLGISFKNFLKNVYYGIVGYLAIVPVLMAMVIATAVVTNIIKYVPERQPVVELFMKEKDVTFLVYTGLFTSLVGPVIEELFFRGFMYNALKKYIGIFWAMLCTASLFAVLHAHVIGFLPIMALGMLLAYLYEKTGTIVSSITVHVMHNMSMVMFVFLIKEMKV